MQDNLMASLVSILSLLIFGLAGCKDSRQRGDIAHGNVLNAETLDYVEQAAGLSFSKDAVLVRSDDGGGRDRSYGFFEWTIFSPTKITLPRMNAPGVTDYIELPLLDTVRFIESRIDKQIAEPQYALGSEWKTNNCNFRGTVVRTSKGDHVIIERYIK